MSWPASEGAPANLQADRMGGQPYAPGTMSHGDGLMKIRKVPADWLDAPRPRGRKSAGPRRKSTNRGRGQPAISVVDQHDPPQRGGSVR